MSEQEILQAIQAIRALFNEYENMLDKRGHALDGHVGRREVSDTELRSMWRAAGGTFYGPHVEHGTMREDLLLPFLRSLIQGAADGGGDVAE